MQDLALISLELTTLERPQRSKRTHNLIKTVLFDLNMTILFDCNRIGFGLFLSKGYLYGFKSLKYFLIFFLLFLKAFFGFGSFRFIDWRGVSQLDETRFTLKLVFRGNT